MRARLYLVLDQLRAGFWFVPLSMLCLSVGLALGLTYFDERFDPGIKTSIQWAYSGGPQGARSLLTTIAGSMITAATVTFSLASVALSIASQQYGSRILRNFMRDRITQVLLGTFVSTFIYSVFVVRAIRGAEDGFVPAVSVTVAIALSVVSLVLLVVFVHHISASIKASHILQVIREDLDSALAGLFPSCSGRAYGMQVNMDLLARNGSMEVTCDTSGYLQYIDMDTLIELARRNRVVIEIKVMPGDHLISCSTVAHILGADSIEQQQVESIAGAFVVGWERTPAQDIRYQFQQLTQVVVRSLSPGINDPFTAITGIDQIATGISQVVRQGPVVRARTDDQGELRVIASSPELDDLLQETVGHIAIYAGNDRFVMAGLRRVLDQAEPYVTRDEDRQCVTQLRRLLSKLEHKSS